MVEAGATTHALSYIIQLFNFNSKVTYMIDLDRS